MSVLVFYLSWRLPLFTLSYTLLPVATLLRSAVGHHREDIIVAFELAGILAAAIGIEPFEHIIKPHLAPRQGRYAFAFQRDFFEGVFGNDVALRAPAFDGYIGKIDIELQFAEFILWLELHAQIGRAHV